MGSNHNLDMYHQLEEMFARLDKMEASNASLKKENTELKVELDRVSRIADHATDRVEELMAQVHKQDDEIVALKQENELLREDNERMKNQLNTDSSNSSKPPSTDQKHKKANEYNGRTKTEKKTGGQKGHPGKTLTKAFVQQKISSGEFDHAIVEHGIAGEKYKTRIVIDMPRSVYMVLQGKRGQKLQNQ